MTKIQTSKNTRKNKTVLLILEICLSWDLFILQYSAEPHDIGKAVLHSNTDNSNLMLVNDTYDTNEYQFVCFDNLRYEPSDQVHKTILKKTNNVYYQGTITTY